MLPTYTLVSSLGQYLDIVLSTYPPQKTTFVAVVRTNDDQVRSNKINAFNPNQHTYGCGLCQPKFKSRLGMSALT